MDLDIEEDKKEAKDILPYLLLIAIIGIGFNLYYKYDRYYLGEALITKRVIIKDRPEYIYSKHGTSRYTFKGTDFNCRFWLSEGALKTINDDESIKREIETVKIGDTIEVKIRLIDELKLVDTAARPRVIEFLKGNRTIISANQVQSEDRKWFYINFGVPIFSLLIWIIIQLKRLIKKRCTIT
ncbi:MAG TPA: hypothetical protein VK166_00940 [Chitinophagaceae bacterium]|nr:hypothetical protein [Chitinophagaceae bacterium]